jgi:hypothetical protein
MTACAYRSLEPVLEQRLVELRERRAGEAFAIDVVQRVAARRLGRAVGGGVALVLAVAAFAVGLESFHEAGADEKSVHELATTLLVAAWGAGIVAALGSRWIGRVVLTATLDAPLRFSGNVAADLASLRTRDPLEASTARAARWERASAALPIAAVSLLAPLTIHWLVWSSLSLASQGKVSFDDFGQWIAWSAVIVGHAHLAVLVGGVRWAFSLRARPTGELRRNLHKHWGVTLLVASGLACIPGIVLLAIPPMLVAVTGLAFMPAMYMITAFVVHRERFAIEALQTAL